MPSRKGPLIALFLWLFLSFGFYESQARREAGHETKVYATKAALGQMLSRPIQSALGSTGILVIGGMGTVAIILWLVKTIQLRAQWLKTDRRLALIERQRVLRDREKRMSEVSGEQKRRD